jgi:hypothetical protein
MCGIPTLNGPNSSMSWDTLTKRPRMSNGGAANSSSTTALRVSTVQWVTANYIKKEIIREIPLYGDQAECSAFPSKRQKAFGLEVPWVAAVQRIPVPSQMLARHELSDESTLKWLYPPPGSDTRYPEVPQGLVQELADSLIERLTPTIAG